jgi:DNA modification methylase
MQDRVLYSKKIDWKQIKTLQPDNFKVPEQQEVLKKSLLANGFVSPFCVWEDPEGVIWSIDGVHRIKALTELQEQGQDIPELLTANFIEAKDRKEAGIILLEVFNTKQNKATEQGLELLKIDLNISNDDLHVDFTDLDIKIELEDPEVTELETAEAPDEAPEPPTIPITAKGDLYELNGHRVLCGDSLLIDDIDKLMQGERADLASNDPPYGMKKENEGIANDNLNFDDLLQFNHDWITLQFSSVLKDNGSWYCWGIDEPLMDIYSNIIKPLIKTQKATFRNLITWNKYHANTTYRVNGFNSPELRSYYASDEKCLFVMCGVQGFNNNADNYFEGWESIRDYLLQSRLAMGWDVPTMKRIVGHSDLSRDHWTSKSQFNMPTREVYNKMKAEADRLRHETNNDAFKKEYDAFKKEYEEIKKEYEEIKKEYYSTRAYFDNTHDKMKDTWSFAITDNNERAETGGHATPKPLELCQRVIKSSCPQDGLVVDAFLGSGSTLIAAEQTNRRCYGIELEEKYCDVIVTRWVKMMKENKKEYVVKRNGEVINWEI